MKLTWRGVGIIGIAAAVACCGCGKGQKPTASRPTVNKDVPLPEWAPENPSPEFLRAAKVLKPYPTEPADGAASAAPEMAALSARMRSAWPAAYDFFGALSDEQVKSFLASREVRIPIKLLTATQRSALDRWFEEYRKAMKGATRGLPIPEDYLVELYRQGADEDLANVDVGFSTVPVGTSSSSIVCTHRVHIWFWVKQSGGGVQQFGYAFAQI